MHSTGMFQLFGQTYRVLRVRANWYQVVRVRDQVLVGSFSCGQTLSVTPLAVDAELMGQLAEMAVDREKTRWQMPTISSELVRTAEEPEKLREFDAAAEALRHDLITYLARKLDIPSEVVVARLGEWLLDRRGR